MLHLQTTISLVSIVATSDAWGKSYCTSRILVVFEYMYPGTLDS